MTPTMSTWCSNQLSYNPIRPAKGIIAHGPENCKDFFRVYVSCIGQALRHTGSTVSSIQMQQAAITI